MNLTKDFIDAKPISKEDHRKMWMDIIEKMHSRSRGNYNKMTEIGNELMKLKGSPENDQIPLREKFHILEYEQISIQRLIDKLNGGLKPEVQSD